MPVKRNEMPGAVPVIHHAYGLYAEILEPPRILACADLSPFGLGRKKSAGKAAQFKLKMVHPA